MFSAVADYDLIRSIMQSVKLFELPADRFCSAVPEAGVYFVNPDLIAAIAASLIFSGVLKSGSPAPNSYYINSPAFNSFAFAVIARC